MFGPFDIAAMAFSTAVFNMISLDVAGCFLAQLLRSFFDLYDKLFSVIAFAEVFRLLSC